MSRIEQALAKAAELRKSQSQAKPKHPETYPVFQVAEDSRVFPEAATRLTIDNQLLVTAMNPHSPVAEEYRKLKSLLVKLTRSSSFLNTIMVTSALPGEGKSVTALNLAISLAQEHDHTVLLIDADLRRPAIHRYLGIKPTIGLSDCLLHDLDVSEALINTGIGKLMVLPAGQPVPNPVELFSSQRMQLLFNEVKHRYPDRYVVIDTPPILPFAEVRHLGHLVDGVLFVVKERLAPLASVAEGLEALHDTNLLGIIYNDVDVSANAAYSYYRYDDAK